MQGTTGNGPVITDSESPVRGASFASALRGGRWLAGTVVSSPDLVLAERIAQAFDFIWIDLEHSALTVRDAQALAIAAKAGGAAALIRLPRPDTELLGAILDTGVDGIVAPRIESAADAKHLVEGIRYPPRGLRGFAPRRASGGRAALEGPAVGNTPVCLIQIESRPAIAQAAEIGAIDGVDGLIVGTADLSFDLGVPLDMTSNELAGAVQAVGLAAGEAGKPWGVAVGGLPEWASGLRQRGASLLVFASDARMYGESIERSSNQARALGDRDGQPRSIPPNEVPGGAVRQGA